MWHECHGKCFKRMGFWHQMGPTDHVSGPRLIGLIFVLPDSNSGKLYAIPKCFRDTDTTAKSVSPNSSSKNLDSVRYANFGKPNTLK